jgi:hypothetical protein
MTFDKKSNIWVTRPADRKLNGGGSRVFQSLPSNPIHSPYKHNHLALFRTIQKQSPSTARIRAPTQANGRYAPCRNFTAASLPLQRPRAHATDSLFTYEKGARAAVKKPAASASASRTGKINKKQIFVFPWSPPRNPSFWPPPRRRRRAPWRSHDRRSRSSIPTQLRDPTKSSSVRPLPSLLSHPHARQLIRDFWRSGDSVRGCRFPHPGDRGAV